MRFVFQKQNYGIELPVASDLLPKVSFPPALLMVEKQSGTALMKSEQCQLPSRNAKAEVTDHVALRRQAVQSCSKH